MAVDHRSPPSAATSPSKKRGRPSKTELKMSLVAKRLAMLQNDHDVLPVSFENPMQCESENGKQMKEKTLDDIALKDRMIMFSANQKICPSSETVRESSNDLSPEAIIIQKSSANRRKCGSHKQKMVISDDESSEDRALVVEVEPRKKKSPKKETVTSDDESSEDRAPIVKVESTKKKRPMQKTGKNEDSLAYKASDIPRKRRIDFTNYFQVTSPAMKRAEEVKANFSDESPSFVKLMLRSHVTQGFWLGLPSKFCGAHLPSTDCTIVLVDEDGLECDTKFLAQKAGLSAGWRGFSVRHDLQEGDVVVFQLIKPTTFKVYIVRAGNLGEVDGALGLLNLDASPGQWITDSPIEKITGKEDSRLLMAENIQGSSDNDIESEVVDGIRFSDTLTSFDSVKSFESFNIVVDGLVIDSKFPESARKKYYELCLSQGAFLHENLLQGLNCNLVSGIISETINIADAIKACKDSTPQDDLRVWERTLKGLELLGMNVRFLVARVRLLLGVGSESDDDIDGSTGLREARLKQARAAENMRALEAKFSELKENMKEIDLKLKAEVNASARKREVQIKDIVNATLW